VEVERYVPFVGLAQKNGESFEAGIRLTFQAILVSPHFLFRGEVQPQPDNPKSVHPVDEFALASRLSYFLWSSMPDDELLQLAEAGSLRKQVAAQTRRMLVSPKSRALVENFAGQWLQIRNLDLVAPDAKIFPNFTKTLRHAMRRETEMVFESIMRDDRPVLELLTADFTYANETLARHYGFKGVQGEEFQKVSLKGTGRKGITTHAGILTLTSHPDRTSPVKRGKWVLESLLGTPPPPAPPNVPTLEDDGRKLTGTLRQRMEQHRENAVCASCHALMDPIGFGFENFDAIGRHRTRDGQETIDPSGKLATGETFDGPGELARILAGPKKDLFVRNLVEKMLTYGLGRGLEYYDKCAVKKIVREMEAADYRFSTLILGVVESVPFQQQRGEEGAATALAASPSRL